MYLYYLYFQVLFFIFLPCLYIFYRFFIARILSVLPENFQDWGGCRPPPPTPLARTPMALTKNKQIS